MVIGVPVEVVTALLGGLGGVVLASLPVLRWVFQTREKVDESLRLLKGSEHIDGDGVIEIVEENRRITKTNRLALRDTEQAPDPREYEDDVSG